ncbi:MAG TPA: hypothetical protein VFZ61_05540 [Polyangiales bacterium]
MLAASLVGTALHAPARAEEPARVRTWYAPLGDTPDARARAERAALQLSSDTSTPLRSVEAPFAAERDGLVPAARLAALERADAALNEARELSGELREAAALRVLADAEQTLLAQLELPGVHAYLAEVYLQLGLCAAQLDQRGLFDTAVARALSLDPARRLEAAEAPPALLARARELGRAQDLAGFSELSLDELPPGARAWVDGVPLSPPLGPARVRTGTHVLVVRAPGYAAYATLLSLEPGPRPPLRIALAPSALEQARLRLSAARGRAEALPAAIELARAAQQPVLLIEPNRAGGDRFLVHRCQASGCEAWLGRQLDAGGKVASPAQFTATRDADRWLNAEPVRDAAPQRPRAAWKRWLAWSASAVAVVAAASVAIWATRPAPVRERRELELDPGALPH